MCINLILQSVLFLKLLKWHISTCLDLFSQLNPCVKNGGFKNCRPQCTDLNKCSPKSVKVKTGWEQLKAGEQCCLPPVGERLCAAHGVGDDSGMLDWGVGELLPGWRQQDLLGAAGPGLLRWERTEWGDKQRGREVEIEKTKRKKHRSLSWDCKVTQDTVFL